ncbi:hypothetical protein DFS33DRAFT_407934 [Desarmillaria ectypa]|nr:hypothetical protein DFS33DRAFT_407934 [Desarmillaria ectypa]
MVSVSKINQLPDELLVLIFATGLRDLSSHEHQPRLALICSICRHWRDVAIEASELWTTIHISLERHIPVTQAFLERSKARLIDVDIVTLDSDSVTAAREVAMITAPHISRARTLTITLPHFSIYTEISEAYRSISANNLASLSIHLTYDLWPLTGHLPLFANTDSLCHFDTQGDLLNVVPSRASLTTLELANYSPTRVDIQNLFSASPCLETLILYGFDRDEPLDRTNEEDAAPVIITAPTSLKSLAVSLYYSHSNGTGSCGCILDKLCIPNLEYLEMVGTTDLELDLNVHFRELAKLQTLHIQRCTITSADEFFLSLKELRRLELVDMSPELDIRRITGASPEDPASSSLSPFPHLSSVFFSAKRGYIESPYQLLQLAERCVAAGCPCFTLEVEKGRSEEFFNAIESCIRDGRVCIKESNYSGGLIKSNAAGADEYLFWDQDEEEMDEWEPEWESEYDGLGGWEEEEDDAFDFDSDY